MNRKIMHIEIVPELFKSELIRQGIDIQRLCNSSSPDYIGVSRRTIQRGLKNGRFSEQTICALSNIMVVDNFIIKPEYDEIDLLIQENSYLKQKIKLLKNEINYLQNKLNNL